MLSSLNAEEVVYQKDAVRVDAPDSYTKPVIQWRHLMWKIATGLVSCLNQARTYTLCPALFYGFEPGGLSFHQGLNRCKTYVFIDLRIEPAVKPGLARSLEHALIGLSVKFLGESPTLSVNYNVTTGRHVDHSISLRNFHQP